MLRIAYFLAVTGLLAGTAVMALQIPPRAHIVPYDQTYHLARPFLR